MVTAFDHAASVVVPAAAEQELVGFAAFADAVAAVEVAFDAVVAFG